MTNVINKKNQVKLFEIEISINLLKKNPWKSKKKLKKIVNKKKGEIKKVFILKIYNLECKKIEITDDIKTKYDISNVELILK